MTEGEATNKPPLVLKWAQTKSMRLLKEGVSYAFAPIQAPGFDHLMNPISNEPLLNQTRVTRARVTLFDSAPGKRIT